MRGFRSQLVNVQLKYVTHLTQTSHLCVKSVALRKFYSVYNALGMRDPMQSWKKKKAKVGSIQKIVKHCSKVQQINKKL